MKMTQASTPHGAFIEFIKFKIYIFNCIEYDQV